MTSNSRGAHFLLGRSANLSVVGSREACELFFSLAHLRTGLADRLAVSAFAHAHPWLDPSTEVFEADGYLEAALALDDTSTVLLGLSTRRRTTVKAALDELLLGLDDAAFDSLASRNLAEAPSDFASYAVVRA